MSDNKKYYYLRLKDNFFDSDELKILESMKDGYLYSNILLKLYLRSLKNDGKLVVNDRIPYNAEMLASVTGHQVGTIKQALSMFKELGLIEILENGAIYMLDIQNFIGKGSTEADRQRLYDRRISEERKQKKLTQSRNLEEILKKSTPEIEIELEKDIEIEKEKEIIHSHVSHDDVDKSHIEIIEYLNLKTGSKFKPTTKPYIQAIRSRLKEGYTVDDFKTVIDKKCREWKGTKLEKYLTPKTLFAPSHFDTYLNSNEMAAMTDTERKVAELNALIDAVERGTDETGNIESYGPTIDISEY